MHVTIRLGTAPEKIFSTHTWLNNVKITKIHVLGEKRKHMCMQHMHTVCAAGDDKCYAYFVLHSLVRMCCVIAQHIWSFVLGRQPRKHHLDDHL